VDAWVGPAIVAAVISGLVSLIVVQLNFRQGRRLEQARRDEKVRDFQIAIRAEIRSERGIWCSTTWEDSSSR
jgi:hypothetical protein